MVLDNTLIMTLSERAQLNLIAPVTAKLIVKRLRIPADKPANNRIHGLAPRLHFIKLARLTYTKASCKFELLTLAEELFSLIQMLNQSSHAP